MKNKEIIWEDVYIGSSKWNGITCVKGERGNSIYAIEITNTTEVLSSDAESYYNFQTTLNNVLSNLGEGMIFQKTDFFTNQVYRVDEEDLAKEAFLQKSYSNHFEGRIFKKIDTILSFTRITPKVTIYNEKEEIELAEKIEKIFRLLNESGFKPRFLELEDFEAIQMKILSQHFGEYRILDNIESFKTHLNIGNLFAKSLSFIDTEKVELPQEIDVVTKMVGNSSIKDTVVDNFSFINYLRDYQNIIYNQVILIPDQTKSRKDLDSKKNRHIGLKAEPYNEQCADEIQEYVINLEKNNQLIVEAHFNIFLCAEDEEKLKSLVGQIGSQLYKKGIVLSGRATNQMELYKSIFPGNSNVLKQYDLFKTTNDVALAFFFKEAFKVDDVSSFYLRFTDRQGVPIKVDTSDLPFEKGQIVNRNKVIIGPSGSGKSFLMNNIFEQCLQYNFDIVVIDVGDSYSSLCSYFKGKYITYREDKPISMNPFNLTKEELNEEKVQTLVELLWIIWESAEVLPSKTQTNVLLNLINIYYDLYFDKLDFNNDTQKMIKFLNLFGIQKEDLISEVESEMKNIKTENHYTALRISINSSQEQIKKAWRERVKETHPDKKGDSDEFVKITKAYTVLSDEVKKAKYDKSLSLLIKREEEEDNYSIIKKDPFTNEFLMNEVKDLAITKIERVKKEFKIDSLSFNSLYEFAEKFLPLHIKSDDDFEKHFNVATYLYNLLPFYKGGRYESVLNEDADESLFNEKFIVFEIDNIKDNPQLFPIVTAVIMDTFIQKMRHREGRRKALFIEEAWKAIASPAMAGMIKYLYKTVRKFWGEVGIITQDLGDIAKSEVVKDAIINSSDILILLDQRKLKKNYSEVAEILNIDEREEGQIFTINNLDNKEGRGKFKEFWMRIGDKSAVYGNEVSLQQYLTYTTEKPEKAAVDFYLKEYPFDYDYAIEMFVDHLYRSSEKLPDFVRLINQNKSVFTEDLLKKYIMYKKETDNALNLLFRNIAEEESLFEYFNIN